MTIIKSLIWIAFLALLAIPAMALSCVSTSPAAAFSEFDAAPHTYQVFEGIITPTQPYVERRDEFGMGIPVKIPAIFDGYGIGPQGRVPHRSRFEVIVNLNCTAHWCGGFPNSEKSIYFFKQGREFSYDSEPCPNNGFQATPENRAEIIACFNGNCDDQQFHLNIDKDACGRKYLEGLIGQNKRNLPPYLIENHKVRIIGPFSAVTKDYRIERLNIETDQAGNILRLRCG